MRKMLRWSTTAGILMVAVFSALLFTVPPYNTCASLASKEYLRHESIEMMPLPKDCMQAGDQPPGALLEVVEAQKNAYELELQKITVCRSPHEMPNREPDFTLAAFDGKTRSRWLPLYVGCCTYQFRRHFTVVIQQNDGQGTVVVMAALIQSRWKYLRFLRRHCDEKLRVWE